MQTEDAPDSTPKDGDYFVCGQYRGPYRIEIASFYLEPMPHFLNEESYVTCPTHWQPLPTPPEATQ